MTGLTYIHIFPIADLDRPISALIAEACMDLDAMAADAGARIVGDPKWTVSGERLICRAPARELSLDEPRPIPSGGRTPAQTIAEIRRLLEHGLGVNAVAYRLGVAAATVRLYRQEAA